MDITGIQKVLPDHTVRAVNMGDVPALVGLVERITTAVLGEPEASESEMRDDLTGAHFDLATDTFIALAPDGSATAYGQGRDEQTGSGWVDVYIDLSLGDALTDTLADAAVGATVSRVVQSSKARGEQSVRVAAGLYENETRMRSAYERAGLVVETVYWRLQRTFAPGELLESPVVPVGFVVAKVDPRNDSVIEQAYHLFHETFSEHHGHEGAQQSLAVFTEDNRGAESFDPEAWWFAWQD
ncbi:MAG: hypothetical protein ABI720_09240, partial [Actinomycetes bacterium]